MKNTKHTKDQRKRLFLLARLLDKVPTDHFSMWSWVTHSGRCLQNEELTDEAFKAVKKHSCGYAACAIGWGMTSPAIRGTALTPKGLISELGFGVWGDDDEAEALFGINRPDNPKVIAADIRAYLKDGTTP